MPFSHAAIQPVSSEACCDAFAVPTANKNSAKAACESVCGDVFNVATAGSREFSSAETSTVHFIVLLLPCSKVFQ